MKRKRTIHFAYAVPRRLIDEVSMRLLQRRVTHPSWEGYPWPSPVHAPYCITYQLATSLSADFRIKLYDLAEQTRIKPEEGDILLGHMCKDPRSVMWEALDNPKFARKYIISPYNHDPVQISFMAEALPKCDRFFAVCGRFWLDTFEKSPLSAFREKVVRLNMGIDLADYPLVKKEFNPPGKRKFFYIGRIGHEKGVDKLENLATDLPGFQGGYICLRGDLAGWTKIAEPGKLTAEFMAGVAREYDIFINMSRADAQVTTVLEAMCWGFPVACTRESGYCEEEGIFYLDLHNDALNREIVEEIQRMDGAELSQIVERNRQDVAQRHNWDLFVGKVASKILFDLCGDR